MADITNNWNASMPSGTSDVAHGDNLMRQHQNSLEITLEEEHYFADSPTSAGIHKAGASRISYGDLASLKTTPEEGRTFYAVDDESLYFTGASATTKLSGAQQGGPVRSSISDTFGWYISSYTTTDRASGTTYRYLNAAGGNMTFREGSQRLLGMSAVTVHSTVSYPYMVQPYSVTSRGIRAIVGRFTNPFDDVTSAAGFNEDEPCVVHVSVMGLIPVSEMS